jgi:AraC family transcriptional regulator
MEIRTERLERMRVLGLRHIGPYSEVYVVWPKLLAHAGSRGLLSPTVQTIGLSYDNPHTANPQTLRYDACLVSDAEGDETLAPIVIEQGRWAIYRLVGPYQQIGVSFDRLFEEVEAKQYELRAAPCMEIYRNDPAKVPPAEYLTDLAVPIV